MSNRVGELLQLLARFCLLDDTDAGFRDLLGGFETQARADSLQSVVLDALHVLQPRCRLRKYTGLKFAVSVKSA